MEWNSYNAAGEANNVVEVVIKVGIDVVGGNVSGA
jgi:hypothetical protein